MRSILKGVLLLGLLLGMPALVMISLFTSDVQGRAISGEQPGGTLSGRVLDEAGHGLSRVELAFVHVPGTGERAPLSSALTRADGSFEIAAPPVEGHYEIVVGGGAWVKQVHGVSFLNRKGRPIEPRSREFVLEPSCRLVLVFSRKDGREVGAGRYVLSGELESGGFFSLVKARKEYSGSIEGGRLELSGLPSMQAALKAEFDGGEAVKFDVDLQPGRNDRQVEL